MLLTRRWKTGAAGHVIASASARARRALGGSVAACTSLHIALSSATELRRTPLYDRHAAAGAKLVPFAGWEMPIQYAGIREEHIAVRTGVGVFDVSHMGQVADARPGRPALPPAHALQRRADGCPRAARSTA